MEAYVSQRKRDVQRRYRPRAAAGLSAGGRPRAAARHAAGAAALDAADRRRAAGAARRGGPSRASFVASTLSASLELVREGDLEARQLEHFAEIYLRARPRG